MVCSITNNDVKIYLTNKKTKELFKMKNKFLLKLLVAFATLTMLATAVSASEIPNPDNTPTDPETTVCEVCGDEDCTCDDNDGDDGIMPIYDPLPGEDML